MADLAAFTRFARTYHPGEIIFAEYEPGDSFYLIQAGKVKITKIVGDIEKTLDILQLPEIFGEMAILEGAPRSATAQAIDTVKVLEFNRANFEVLMMGNPQIALRLLKLFTKRIWDQKRRFMILTLDDPRPRSPTSSSCSTRRTRPYAAASSRARSASSGSRWTTSPIGRACPRPRLRP